MENWKSHYEHNFEQFLDELIHNYLTTLKKAGNKEFVHFECKNAALKDYDFIQQNDSLPYTGQIFTIATIISDMGNRVKTPFNKAFEQITKDYTQKEQKIIIKKIAKIKAYSNFCNNFLPKKEKEFEKLKLSNLELVRDAANIFDDNIRDFVKLPPKDISKEDLDNWVKEDLRGAKDEIEKKMSEFETTNEKLYFLNNMRNKIIAAYLPIISNTLQGGKNEPYSIVFYEKMSEITENKIDELEKISEEHKVYTYPELKQNNIRNMEKYKPLLLKDMAIMCGFHPRTMRRRIDKLIEENKFNKKGTERYFSIVELQILEKLLGYSFQKTN